MSVERQQGRAYRLDLFDEALLKDLRLKAPKAGGTGTRDQEERQALAASAEQRALMGDVMERVVASANLNQAFKRKRSKTPGGGFPGSRFPVFRGAAPKPRQGLLALGTPVISTGCGARAPRKAKRSARLGDQGGQVLPGLLPQLPLSK